MTLPRVTGHRIGAHARNDYPTGGGYQRGNLAELNAAIMAARGGQPATWGRGEAPHGTAGAASRHRRGGQPLCDDCEAYERRRRQDRNERERAARAARRAAA